MKFLTLIGVILSATLSGHSQVRQVSATFTRDASDQILITNHSDTAKIVALRLDGACDPSRRSSTLPDEMQWGLRWGYRWSIGDFGFTRAYNSLPIPPGKTGRFLFARSSLSSSRWTAHTTLLGGPDGDFSPGCTTAIVTVFYSDGTVEGDPSSMKWLLANRRATLDEIHWAIELLRREDSEERSPSEILEVLRLRQEHLKSAANPGGDLPFPGSYFDSKTFMETVAGTVGGTGGTYLSRWQRAMVELNRYAQEIRASTKPFEGSRVLEASDKY